MLASRSVNHIRSVLSSARTLSATKNFVRRESGHNVSGVISSTDDNISGVKQTNNRTFIAKELSPSADSISFPILDTPQPVPTLPSRPVDPLKKAIWDTRSLRDLLSLISLKEKELEPDHLFDCVTLIFEAQQKRGNFINTESLHNNKGFISLCRQIRRKASLLTENQLIRTLKMLSQCQVPSESRVVQAILHIIKSRVNDLDLQQIIYMHFLLTKFEPIPIVEALRMALPIVFDTQLETQLEASNLPQLVSTLQYAMQHNVQPRLILEYLLNYEGEWDSKSASSVLVSLSRLEMLDNSYAELVRKLLAMLSKSVNEVSPSLLLLTVSRITHSFPNGHTAVLSSPWYCEQFIESVLKRAMFECWDLRRCETLTKCLVRISYVNLDFLQYLANQVVRDPESCEKISVFRLIRAFALSNFKPDYMEQIMKSILSSPIIKSDRLDLPWIRLLLDCAVLGLYPRDLLRKVLDPQFLGDLLRKGIQQDITQLVYLNQALHVEAKDYEGPFPDSAILQKNTTNHKESSLSTFLELAMGGSSYVLNKAVTRLGHHIDHVVVLRNGGFPVAFNKSDENEVDPKPQFVEDITVPKDGKIVLIRVHGPESYAINAYRLRGFVALENRVLAAMGYVVVDVGQQQWNLLHEREKVSFLMRQIFLSTKD